LSIWKLLGASVQRVIHRSQIMRKMAAGSFAELVRMASQLDIPMARIDAFSTTR